MSRDLLNIAVVGAGSIAASHLKTFTPENGARAVAIADVNEEAARARAQEFGIPHVYRDYKEMLELPEIDAVVVCVPNFLHAPVSLAALEKGKHVLCEKPMAIDESDARAMVELAQEQQKILMVGQNYRYRPEVDKVRQLLEDGTLGRIYWVKVGWMRRKGIPGWGSWFTQKDKSGGGCLIDIGVHMLDVGWYLMGAPRPLTVVGSTFAAFGPEKRGLGGWGTPNWDGHFDVDDGATAVVRFEGGATLTLDVSWAANHPDRMWLHIMGDRGGVTMFDGPLTVYREVDGQVEQWQPEVEQKDPRDEVTRHFVHCCRTGERPRSPGEHGLEVTRMLLGIYRSSETGREAVLYDPGTDAQGAAS